MVTDQLLTFIKDQLRLGVSKDAIIQMLSGQGWSTVDIQQAFAAVSPAPVPPPPPIAPAPPVVSAPNSQPTYSPLSTPPIPPAPPLPPTPQSATTGAGFSVDSLQKNPKFMMTIKTFAIYSTIIYIINVAIGMVISTLHFSTYYNAFSVFALVGALIIGVIGSIIGGAIFYFLYDPIHNWVKRSSFLSRHIHDMFTLFWKPYLVVFVISAAFGLLGMFGLGASMIAVTAGYAAASFGALFIGWAITCVVQIAVYYWYAKTVSAKLTAYYPW